MNILNLFSTQSWSKKFGQLSYLFEKDKQKGIKNKMVKDIFDQKILCEKCDKIMIKENLQKNGFVFRTMKCTNGECNHRIIHPLDEQEYNKFINLKNKDFRVKMRLVGNSYAVSIPKEIVSFMNEHQKIMDEMVRLCFEDCGRISLNFKELENER